jgi:hypothetical protein
VISGTDAIRRKVVRKSVGTSVHLGVRAALPICDNVFALSEVVDRVFK